MCIRVQYIQIARSNILGTNAQRHWSTEYNSKSRADKKTVVQCQTE